MRPLLISSWELGRSLGRSDLLKLDGLVQEKLLRENQGFPVRNSSSNFSRGAIRFCCLDQSSHDIMKALINSALDLGYLAQSPEELPHLRGPELSPIAPSTFISYRAVGPGMVSVGPDSSSTTPSVASRFPRGSSLGLTVKARGH